MTTITQAMLQNKIDYLNKITNSPKVSYVRDGEKFTAQIGNFNLYQAYGAYGLHRMVNEGGGVTDRYINGLHTKRELFGLLSALIDGFELEEKHLESEAAK